MIIISISIGLALVYLLLQAFYLFHWWKTPPLIVSPQFSPKTPLSIIVVAHNEESSIEKSIRAILNQNYPEPLFEIIVINDRSTDRTADVVNNIGSTRVKLFNLTDHPEFIRIPAFKKSGITLGVHLAKHDWIVVTDADCVPGKNWLRMIAHASESGNAVFMTAPIYKVSGKNYVEKMQEMENLALMVITAAGIRSGLHDLANGANMSFSKSAFRDVNGYEGNFRFASGDDMFLIEKMRHHFPGQIIFLKSHAALALTPAKKDWKSLIRQRLRWAGKNHGLKSPVVNIIWGFVGIYHIAIIISFILLFVADVSLLPFIILFVTKWIIDFIMIQNASLYFTNRPFQGNTIVLQLVYMYYVLRLGWKLMLGKKGGSTSAHQPW